MAIELVGEEKDIFELLKRSTSVSLDKLVERFGGDRNSMVVRIKYLTAKVAPEGWIISKTTATGRGVKAIYEMEKKF